MVEKSSVNSTLERLTDVGISAPTNGQVLTYSGGTWVNSAGGGAGGGTVTTSGSPVNGNLTKFSGASVITNGDLSGDVITSGTLATTIAKIAGVTIGTPTGTGNIVFSNSPTLVTPALGTPASGVATNLTGTASGLTAGTVTTNANLTGPITSSGNITSIASQTGTGTKFVVDTSPTLVTPTLGVATATSINKVVITAPASSSTLTIADGKTATINNTLTFSGTDSTAMAFPSSSSTVLTLGNTASLTVGYSQADYSGGTQSSGTFTPSETNGNMQRIVNGGAFTLAPPSNNTMIMLEITNNGSAGSITTSGFTKVVGDAFTTTNTSIFQCFITKFNSHSTLNVIALQ